MDIQLEKIELIRRLTEVDSEVVIKNIKAILAPEKKNKMRLTGLLQILPSEKSKRGPEGDCHG